MQAEPDAGKVQRLKPRVRDIGATPVHVLDQELLQRNLITGFDPTNIEDVHPFSILRSQLLKHVRATDERVFAIMSVQPGNGKTHVAVNLAAALGRIRPTVLVELDLRRPSIGKCLGLPHSSAGIEDCLAGTASLQDSAIRIDGTQLTVHRVRSPNMNPENMLSSTKLAEIANALRSIDDQPIVIIDTPPAVIHDDIMLISPVLDGAIMVVQEARTTKRALLGTIKSLSPTPVIGTVLNMSISSPPQTAEYGDYYTIDPDEGPG